MDTLDTFEWKAYKQMRKSMDRYQLSIDEYNYMKFYIQTSIPVDIIIDNDEIYINVFNNDISLIKKEYKEKLLNLIQIYSNYLFNVLDIDNLLKEYNDSKLDKIKIEEVILNKVIEYEIKNKKTIKDEFCILLYSLIITNIQKLNERFKFS